MVEKRFKLMQGAMVLIAQAQAIEAGLLKAGYILTDNDSGTTWKKKIIFGGEPVE